MEWEGVALVSVKSFLWRFLLFAYCAWLAVLPASAAGLDRKWHVPVAAAGLFGWGALSYWNQSSGPMSCSWCDANSTGQKNLNPLDRVAMNWQWSHPDNAADLSDVSVGLLLPSMLSMAYVADSNLKSSELANDSLLVIEALAAAGIVNQIVKRVAARKRPKAWEQSSEKLRPDDFASFYSGHASTAFSLAVSVGTVAELRQHPYRKFIWGLGLGLAGATAYLRVAAGEHYLSDVGVGALGGALLGFLLPWIFFVKAPENKSALSARPQLMWAPTQMVIHWSW